MILLLYKYYNNVYDMSILCKYSSITDIMEGCLVKLLNLPEFYKSILF